MRRNTSRGPSFFVYCEDNQDERLDLGPVETGARPHHACCWPKGEGGIGGDFFTLAGGGGGSSYFCPYLCGIVWRETAVLPRRGGGGGECMLRLLKQRSERMQLLCREKHIPTGAMDIVITSLSETKDNVNRRSGQPTGQG